METDDQRKARVRSENATVVMFIAGYIIIMVTIVCAAIFGHGPIR